MRAVGEGRRGGRGRRHATNSHYQAPHTSRAPPRKQADDDGKRRRQTKTTTATTATTADDDRQADDDGPTTDGGDDNSENDDETPTTTKQRRRRQRRRRRPREPWASSRIVDGRSESSQRHVEKPRPHDISGEAKDGSGVGPAYGRAERSHVGF